MNDLFDNAPEPQRQVTWPQVAMGAITGLVILGLCFGCVAVAWIWSGS